MMWTTSLTCHIFDNIVIDMADDETPNGRLLMHTCVGRKNRLPFVGANKRNLKNQYD